MLKLFKNSFKQTNDCIILATPLIIFLSILSWYFSYASSTVDNIPKLILAGITIFVMAAGFFSAWFYMVKKTLKFSNKLYVFDKDRAKAFGNLILSLPKGIGKLFLPFLGIIAISTIFYGFIFAIITYFVWKYIGTVNLDFFDIKNLMVSSKELIYEVSQLSKNELIVINCWYLLVLICTTITSFITMLWIPEVVYCEKNPFKALYYAIKKIFISFPKSILLFIYINILTFGISVLNTFLMFNPIAYFVVLLLYYYLIVYIVVLVFSYYEQTFLK